jgi:hypothetical protein
VAFFVVLLVCSFSILIFWEKYKSSSVVRIQNANRCHVTTVQIWEYWERFPVLFTYGLLFDLFHILFFCNSNLLLFMQRRSHLTMGSVTKRKYITMLPRNYDV